MSDFHILPNIRLLLNPALDCIWINIPKNGSSFMQKILQDNGWHIPHPDCHDALLSSNIRKFFIARNPMERWISGFAECFMDTSEILDLLDNNTFLDIIIKYPVFDGHTVPQSKFVPNMTNAECIHIVSNQPPERFFYNVQEWVNESGGKTDCGTWSIPVNPKDNHPIKEKIYLKLQTILQGNPEMKQQISNFYLRDTHLINTVKRREFN